MVFASSAIAQAAALGVALSFWIPAARRSGRGTPPVTSPGPAAHVTPSLLFEPVLWAIAASLLATLVFIANPVHLHLTRESLLGFVFLASGAGAVIVGDRDHPGGARPVAILFGSAVVVQTMDLYLVARRDRRCCSAGTSCCGARCCSRATTRWARACRGCRCGR